MIVMTVSRSAASNSTRLNPLFRESTARRKRLLFLRDGSTRSPSVVVVHLEPRVGLVVGGSAAGQCQRVAVAGLADRADYRDADAPVPLDFGSRVLVQIAVPRIARILRIQ